MKSSAFFAALLVLAAQTTFAQNEGLTSYHAYQSSVYAQTDTLPEMENLYTQAEHDIKLANFSSAEELALLAALCELRIRSLLFFGKKEEAAKILTAGIKLAELSLAQKPTALAYAALSSLYSIGTKIKSGTMVSSGLKVLDTTKKALKLDEKNPTAVHLMASSYVYAPVPFRNLKKGIPYIKNYLEKTDPQTLSKTELFNLTVCLADAYEMLEDAENTKIWLDKSALLFPDNKSVTERDGLNLK